MRSDTEFPSWSHDLFSLRLTTYFPSASRLIFPPPHDWFLSSNMVMTCKIPFLPSLPLSEGPGPEISEEGNLLSLFERDSGSCRKRDELNLGRRGRSAGEEESWVGLERSSPSVRASDEPESEPEPWPVLGAPPPPLRV